MQTKHQFSDIPTSKMKSYEVRKQWFHLLSQIRDKRERVIVTDSGNESLVIISIDEYTWLVAYNEEMRKHIL